MSSEMNCFPKHNIQAYRTGTIGISTMSNSRDAVVTEIKHPQSCQFSESFNVTDLVSRQIECL